MPEKFEASNERIETGAPAKRKGKSVSVDGKQGECYQWKAKGQCTRGDACSFRHDENKRGKSPRSSLLFQNRRQSSMGKILRKESLLEARVRLGRDIEDRAKATSVGNARTPLVWFMAVLFCAERLTVSPQKTRKKVKKRICCLVEEFQATRLRIPRHWTAEIQSDFAEGHKIPRTKAQNAILKQCITPHENLGKNGSIARCDSAHQSSWAQPSGSKKRLWNKSDAPAETRGKWQNVFSISKGRTKLHSCRLRMFGVYQRHS